MSGRFDCSNPKPGLFPARCGKCSACLEVRRRDWISRSVWECFVAQKTWFCTFTFRPGAPDRYAEFQKFMKRLRKDGAKGVRYLVTGERGTTGGRFHLHALLHGDRQLTQRLVRSNWTQGYSQASLVRSSVRCVRYVSKYLAKQIGEGHRVRASLSYGLHAHNVLMEKVPQNEIVASVLHHFPGSVVSSIRINGVRPSRRVWKEFRKFVSSLPPSGPRLRPLGGLSELSGQSFQPSHDYPARLHHLRSENLDAAGRSPLNPFYGLEGDAGDASPAL